jgi:hypothetical protein
VQRGSLSYLSFLSTGFAVGCALCVRCCFGGDFGDDAATLARAAQWRRENPDLAVRQAKFFHSLWDDPGGAVAKEELLALGLSPDYRHECGICDRDYMLRRGCPCCRD